MRDHSGDEDLHTVDGAPEIDGQDPLPGGNSVEQAAARLDAGIVHQHVDLAEAVEHRGFEPAQVIAAGHVGGDRQGFAPRPCQRMGSGVEPFARQVGQRHLQAHGSEAFGGGEADTGCAAGDDRDISRAERRVGHAVGLRLGRAR